MASIRFDLAPADMWEFFKRNQERLKEEMTLCVENTETGYGVWLTSRNNAPELLVCRGDDDPEDSETALTDDDLADAANRLISKYLLPMTIDEDEVDVVEEEPDMYFIEEEREAELYDAFESFLSVVMELGEGGAESTFGSEEVADMMDCVLQVLADECGLEEIWRPMEYIDDDGNEAFTNFPYMSDEGQR